MALFDIPDYFWELFKAVRGETTTGLTSSIEALAQAERTKANSYFANIIDQIPHDTADYRRLRNFLRDWYSTHKTFANLTSQLTDPRSMTNEQLDILFQSFGFPYASQLRQSNNEPLESKINLFLDLVNLYKIKGTPQGLLEVLQYFGVPKLDIYEFWLRLDEDGELEFRGNAVAGTTVNPSQIDLNYNFLTDVDPHWLYTADQIKSLNQSLNINLPSKTPYIGIQPVAELGPETAILVRTVQDQYDSYEASGDLPTQNAEVTIVGETVSLLELYLLIIYVFYKEYDTGVSDGTAFVCYDGTNTVSADIIAEYNAIVDPVVTSRQNQLTRLAQYYDTFTRHQSRNFLTQKTSAQTILQTINPSLVAAIDALADPTKTILNSLLKDLGVWVRNNIGFGFINLGFILSGLQAYFSDLDPVINFFKPYRARVIILERLLIRDRLFNSIVLEDQFSAREELEFRDYLTGNSTPCCSNPELGATCDSTSLNYYSRATYDCGSNYDIGAVTDGKDDAFQIELTHTIEDRFRCSTNTDSTALVSSEIIDITYSADNIKSLDDGDTYVSGTFASDQTDTSFALVASVFRDNGDSDEYNLIVTNKQTTSYRVDFSDAINGDNYYISFKALRGTYTGTEDIPSGASEIRIDFPAAYETDNYSIVYNLANYTDPNPTVYGTVMIERDDAGFKVRLSEPTDSANYKIEWAVIEAVAAPTPSPGSPGGANDDFTNTDGTILPTHNPDVWISQTYGGIFNDFIIRNNAAGLNTIFDHAVNTTEGKVLFGENSAERITVRINNFPSLGTEINVFTFYMRGNPVATPWTGWPYDDHYVSIRAYAGRDGTGTYMRVQTYAFSSGAWGDFHIDSQITGNFYGETEVELKIDRTNWTNFETLYRFTPGAGAWTSHVVTTPFLYYNNEDLFTMLHHNGGIFTYNAANDVEYDDYIVEGDVTGGAPAAPGTDSTAIYAAVVSGVEDVGIGRSGITVNLPVTQDNKYYAVFANIINEVDSTSLFIATSVRNKTTSSFYVDFSQLTDSGNYQVSWYIVPQIPVAEDISFRQLGGFQPFDTGAAFDCTHGFDYVEIDIDVVAFFLLLESGGYLLQENGAKIKLESSA